MYVNRICLLSGGAVYQHYRIARLGNVMTYQAGGGRYQGKTTVKLALAVPVVCVCVKVGCRE